MVYLPWGERLSRALVCRSSTWPISSIMRTATYANCPHNLQPLKSLSWSLIEWTRDSKSGNKSQVSPAQEMLLHWKVTRNEVSLFLTSIKNYESLLSIQKTGCLLSDPACQKESASEMTLFRKDVWEKSALWHLSASSVAFGSALKRGAGLGLFHLSWTDHWSGTIVVTHQVCLMDPFCLLLVPLVGEVI